MSPWEKLRETPHTGGHYVQLYQTDDGSLTENVGQYFWEGLRRGDGVLIIATPEHEASFSRHLELRGIDVSALRADGQLCFLDAHETLAKFMVAGQPNWNLFERVVRHAMRGVHPASGREGLRAYGEMVGILWKNRWFAAAIRLEQYWNGLLEQSSFSLYCAYAIDIFGSEFEVAQLEGVLCTHTHLLPARSDGALETALNRAMDEILGPKAEALRVLIKANYRPAWAVMPTAERAVLWLRKNLPEQADHIIGRARDHYNGLLNQPVIPLATE